MESSLDSLDWGRLERLRARFLADAPEPRAVADYWSCEGDLAGYDAVFATRIGWKWDAVFDELDSRGIRFDDAATVVDFGCGTGIATRRFLRRVAKPPRRVLLHDRSARAMAFAADRVRETDAAIAVREAAAVPDDVGVDVLLVSHVLGELSARTERGLLDLVGRSRAVLWVEPGSHGISRRLSAIRDGLRDRFEVLAPCTHARACPALADHDRDWCHFFASPPGEVFTDARWVKIGKQLGIDLRSLPYSCLVLRANADAEIAEGAEHAERMARVLGRPTVRPKLARFFACDAGGLREVSVFKSQAPEDYRRVKKAGAGLRTWRVDS